MAPATVPPMALWERLLLLWEEVEMGVWVGVDACAGARLARLGGVAQLPVTARRCNAEAEPARW